MISVVKFHLSIHRRTQKESEQKSGSSRGVSTHDQGELTSAAQGH
jgi:hypothetical protein